MYPANANVDTAKLARLTKLPEQLQKPQFQPTEIATNRGQTKDSQTTAIKTSN